MLRNAIMAMLAVPLAACATGEPVASTATTGQDTVARDFADNISSGGFSASRWGDANFVNDSSATLAALSDCQTDTIDRLRPDLWGVAWRCTGISGRPGALLTFDGATLVKVEATTVRRQYTTTREPIG